MKRFFLNTSTSIPFKLGGMIHICCILLLISGLLIIYVNKDRIKSIKNKGKIKIIMFLIMFFNMFIYYISYAYYGVYDWKVHLPLHFCFISGILFMIYLITNKQCIFKIVYFFSLAGPLPAVLFPDLKTSFDSFIFYQYFISHHLFIIFSFFVLYLDNVYIKFNDMIKSIIVSICILMTMALFNTIFGTNYIMSKTLPTHVLELFPFLKYFNSPMIILIGMGILIMFIAYIPVYFENRALHRK